MTKTIKDEPCVIKFKLLENVEYGYPEYSSLEIGDHIKDILYWESHLEFDHDETEEIMPQSKAVEFAKKYLEDRLYELVKNDDYTHIIDVAIDYVTNDIIPHIYGEALD